MPVRLCLKLGSGWQFLILLHEAGNNIGPFNPFLQAATMSNDMQLYFQALMMPS